MTKEGNSELYGRGPKKNSVQKGVMASIKRETWKRKRNAEKERENGQVARFLYESGQENYCAQNEVFGKHTHAVTAEILMMSVKFSGGAEKPRISAQEGRSALLRPDLDSSRVNH